MSEVFIDPFIEINDGTKFYLAEQEIFNYDARAIAHSLAQMNRWTGHTERPMSVAEHSVLVSLLVPEEYALEGLLHDASESFIADIARPFKTEIHGYKEVEKPLQESIYNFFEVERTEESSAIVKQADTTSLLIEAYQLMPSKGLTWPYYDDMMSEALPGTEHMLKVVEVGKWDWQQARAEFYKRFEIIKGTAFSQRRTHVR